MNARNWGLLLFLSLLWGGSFFFYKVLVATLPPLTVVLGRVGIAAIALNLALLLAGRPVPWNGALFKRFLLLGLLNNVIPFILICWGETRISSGLASILNATTPIFIVVVAHVLTDDEKFSTPKLAAVALGFAGVLVLIGPAAFTAGQQLGGEVAVLVGALVYAFGATYGKRFKGLPPIQIATGQITAATLIMLPLALAIDRPWTLAMPSLQTWAALLAIALISTALAYAVFYHLMASVSATNISLVTFLLPVNALWLGAAFLGETVTWQALAGMALIGSGLAVIDGRFFAANSQSASIARRRCRYRPPITIGDTSMPSRFARRTILSAVLLLSMAPLALAATYKVTSAKDDGPGTLRWAIAQNNANPGDNAIDIAPSGKGPFVIKLKSLLPPLKGPLAVKGPTRILNGEVAPAVAVDGSLFINGEDELQCPPSPVPGGGAARDEAAPARAGAPAAARGGAAARTGGPNVRSIDGAAFAITDTGHVRISNLEIRSFCIGVMILRSHDNQIDHNWIHDTAGAAGVLVTGDDGKGGSTAGLTVHNVVEYNHIYETGDGGECTRGTADLIYRFNMMWESRKRPNVPYSQGVECAGAGDDRISFIGNSFTGYSDGLQLNSATNVLVAGNTITGTTYGITAAGSGLIVGNVLSGNRMAIGPSAGSHITISRNSISDNGHAEILSVAGSAGGTTDAASPNLGGIVFVTRGGGGRGGAAAAAPPAPPAMPTLDASSAWDKAPLLNGALAAEPNAPYRLEFFASHAPDASGKAQGEVFLGAADVTTDAQGAAQFHFTAAPNPLGDNGTKAYFTATATGPGGATSSFSTALVLGH